MSATRSPAAPFEEPWQAELFALTVALGEAGVFGWPDWTSAFGATLKTRGAARALEDGARVVLSP